MHTPIQAEPAADIAADERARVRRRRIAVIVGVLLVAAIGLFLATRGGGEPAAGPVAQQQAASVTVIVPGRTTVSDEINVTGTIAARREMPVGVQGEGGMVNAVLVEAGDYVREGQVLARIDRAVQAQQLGQMQAQLVQARADARLAQAELDRAQALVERGFVSKADIDRRVAKRDADNARANVAAAQVREMQARLGRLDVRAPESGLVLARSVEAGQVVGAGGQPLFRIAENGAMELRAAVAEQDLAKLKVGMPAQVQLTGSPRLFQGEIWLLEPVVDPTSRQGIARVALVRDRELRPGAFASAKIAAGRTIRPVLPQSAVQVDDRGSYVYVVGSDDRVARRDIRVGVVSNEGIAIASGLTGGERVVLSAGAFLNPGEKVKPVLQRRAS